MTDTPFTDRDFRNAMGSFATGICVMGAKRRDGVPIGMTVNSFSSVSLNPPMALVCLNAHSPRSQAIIDAGRFAVSMLADDQRAISEHFAKPGEGMAPDQGCREGENGAMIVDNAAAVVECDIDSVHEAGDHWIVVGRVTHVASNQDQGLLMIARGQYRHVTAQGD